MNALPKWISNGPVRNEFTFVTELLSGHSLIQWSVYLYHNERSYLVLLFARCDCSADSTFRQRRYNFRLRNFHLWTGALRVGFQKMPVLVIVPRLIFGVVFLLNEMFAKRNFGEKDFYCFFGGSFERVNFFHWNVHWTCPADVWCIFTSKSLPLGPLGEDADVYERWNLKISASACEGMFIVWLSIGWWVGERLIGRVMCVRIGSWNADGLQTTLFRAFGEKRIRKVVHVEPLLDVCTLLWNVCRRFPRDFSRPHSPFSAFFLARETVCSAIRRGFSRENAQPSVIAQGAMKGRNVSHWATCDPADVLVMMPQPGSVCCCSHWLFSRTLSVEKRLMMQRGRHYRPKGGEAGREANKVRRTAIKLSEPRAGVTRCLAFNFFTFFL
jgi:hypothetical protein